MDTRRRELSGKPRADQAETTSPTARRRPRLTPLPPPGQLKAFVLAPPSADLDVLRAWLGAGWKLTVAANR